MWLTAGLTNAPYIISVGFTKKRLTFRLSCVREQVSDMCLPRVVYRPRSVFDRVSSRKEQNVRQPQVFANTTFPFPLPLKIRRYG